MYLVFVPWAGACGQWMKFPCGYGIYGMCGSQPVQAGGWTPLRLLWVCAEEFRAPGCHSLVSQLHLGARGSPAGVCSCWGTCADWHRGSSASGCSRDAFRLTGAAPGQQERRENVLGGGGGTGGRKVGAAFLGPGRARTFGSKWKKGAVVWCQIAPSVPWGPAVRNKEEH